MKKSNETLKIFLLCVLAVVLGLFFVKYFMLDNIAPFKSNIDGQMYEVREIGSPHEKQTAADYLAKIKGRVDELVLYMYENELPDTDTSRRLFYRWSKCELKETSSNESTAAYTLNKSEEIRLCIRKQDGSFENINTSMFVVLHELAHVMSVTYGHGEEFKRNFSYITHLASNLGIYKPENFRENPVTYCGTEINTTPCDAGTCKYKIV